MFVKSNIKHKFAHIRSSGFLQFDDKGSTQMLFTENTSKAKALLRITSEERNTRFSITS